MKTAAPFSLNPVTFDTHFLGKPFESDILNARTNETIVPANTAITGADITRLIKEGRADGIIVSQHSNWLGQACAHAGIAKVLIRLPESAEADVWSPTPPAQPGFYWLKRRDESVTVVCVSKSMLCFSTHGHSGSKVGSLQGLWSGPITPPR